MPAFTPQPQDVTALWLVLIAPIHEGMARLTVRVNPPPIQRQIIGRSVGDKHILENVIFMA